MDGHQISILPEAGLWDFLAALSKFRKSMFCIKLLISRVGAGAKGDRDGAKRDRDGAKGDWPPSQVGLEEAGA